MMDKPANNYYAKNHRNK